MVGFRGLDGNSFSGGVLEMDDDGCGAWMAGEVIVNFLEVF